MRKVLSCVLVMVLLASAMSMAITPAAAQQAGIPCDDGDNELTKDELVNAILPYMLDEGGVHTLLDDVGDAAWVYAYWGGESKTVIDTQERSVTIYRPIERVIPLFLHPVETMRSLKVPIEERMVGMGYTDPVFYPELSEVPNVGCFTPDIEAILKLHPDAVILHAGFGARFDSVQDACEAVGITIFRLNFNQPDIYLVEAEKLGYILDKRTEAEELIDFYENILNSIEERVENIPPDGYKPKVYYESSTKYKSVAGTHSYIDFTGGIDIFQGAGGFVDPEKVAAQNPDIIVKMISYSDNEAGGYHLDADDTAGMEAIRDGIMSRYELLNVNAVKNGSVYIISSEICGTVSNSCRAFVQIAYQAKWFNSTLFENLDPKAIHQEYLTEFQGVDIDLNEKGVFVYPEEPI